MIVLDVETTGLNAEKNSLVSIGALDFDNPDDRFYRECRIWEGAEINETALNVNGYTTAEITDKNKPSEAEAVQEFFEWLKDKNDLTIAGQNVYMDISFIEEGARRAGLSERLPKRTFEQHTAVLQHMISRGLTPPIENRRSKMNSDEIMKYVGIPEEPKPHIAINGVTWEYEAIHRILYNKPGLEEFKQYPVPWIN